MIVVKAKTHTTRLFAEGVSLSDIAKPVAYFSYQGDMKRVPWWYSREKGYSARSDLALDESELLSRMKSNTRNEIRRAEKEGCRFDIVEDLDEFVPFYNAFCRSKGLNDFVSRARLGKYKDILITKATCQGKTLAMHANILDKNTQLGVLILSCSQRLDAGVDKKLIGWGNRFLHYKELEYLKAEGYRSYDWSGVVVDPNDPLYSIGQFKLAFGGDLVESWTLKSPLYRMLEGVRNFIVRFRK